MKDILDAVTRIEVPTPFPVGPVNSYLIEGEPLTLIDTGPKTSKSLAAIQQGLHALSYELSDIEQILLTHSHVDHVGLVAKFVSERVQSLGLPTEVWIHQNDAKAVMNYEEYMEQYTDAFGRLIMASGVVGSETEIPLPTNRAEFFKAIGESVPTAHTFNDNAIFKTGIGELSTIWVPGHSPGSTCFVCENRKVIFSGDHILGDISSNPSISFNDTEKIGMLTYLESLDRLIPIASYIALPGHRKPIIDIRNRIDTLHQEYTDKLQRATESLRSVPQTIYDMSRVLYGNYNAGSLVLALAETYDILRILKNMNRAELITQNGVVSVVKRWIS